MRASSCGCCLRGLRVMERLNRRLRYFKSLKLTE